MTAFAVSLVPLAALAALGGAYRSSTLPLLAAAAAVFLVITPRIAARDTALMDVAILAFVAAAVAQIVPLPSAVIAVVSPRAPALQDMLWLQSPAVARPLTIDPRLTRDGIASALTSVLVFWAAREVFARGGVRVLARVIAFAGAGVALLALAQRATAPGLLLWTWKPLDPGAQPFGPFVNRNHFAAWLLMAACLTGGCLVAHLRSQRIGSTPSKRLLVRDLLSDGTAPLLMGALGLMLTTMAASASRAALTGTMAALALALAVGRRRSARRQELRIAGVIIIALTVGALWLNREAVASRLDSTIAGRAIDRPVIWRETAPIVRDFWLAGTGLGTYPQAMLRYQETARERLFNQAHNEYLQLAAEGGLLLLVPATLGAWAALRLTRARLRADVSDATWIRLGAVAGLAGICLQGFFDSVLRMPANALLAAVLVAIAVHERGRTDADESA